MSVTFRSTQTSLRERERLLVQAKDFIRVESDRLLPGGNWPGTASTWRGNCVREMVASTRLYIS